MELYYGRVHIQVIGMGLVYGVWYTLGYIMCVDMLLLGINTRI